MYTIIQKIISYLSTSVIRLLESYKMTPTQIFLSLFLLLNTLVINGGEKKTDQTQHLIAIKAAQYGVLKSPFEKKKFISSINCEHTCVSLNLPSTSPKIRIEIGNVQHSTVGVFVPSSVKNIILKGDIASHSSIIFYAQHWPIIANKITNYSHSSIKIMHPIRRFTVPITLCGLFIFIFYQFTKE